jgi:DNA-binding CsgD family transcriptional regulator
MAREGRFVSEEKGSGLTAKEREIVRLLLSGLTVKEIAATTGRHQSTVYEHLHRIRERLGLRTIAEVAVYGVRHGLDHHSERQPNHSELPPLGHSERSRGISL